jgi:prophage maintenance system killer protein
VWKKDRGVDAALGAVMQSFDGRDLYPSVEEKGANLLYFVVKNHPFTDGNKPIGAALFLRFMEKNEALYRADGSKRIADNALVAMTLLIAESKPAEHDATSSMSNADGWVYGHGSFSLVSHKHPVLGCFMWMPNKANEAKRMWLETGHLKGLLSMPWPWIRKPMAIHCFVNFGVSVT